MWNLPLLFSTITVCKPLEYEILYGYRPQTQTCLKVLCGTLSINNCKYRDCVKFLSYIWHISCTHNQYWKKLVTETDHWMALVSIYSRCKPYRIDWSITARIVTYVLHWFLFYTNKYFTFIYPTECTTRLKFALKCSYMFQLTNHHQGAYCCALLMLIKIVS